MVGADGLDDRYSTTDLLVRFNGACARSGGLGSHVDDGGSLSDDLTRSARRVFDMEKSAAVAKRIGGDVEHAHHGCGLFKIKRAVSSD